MNAGEAHTLAIRIANCWRGGAPVREWEDALQRLDHTAAVATFERLRGNLEHPPTLARFMAEYRALTPARTVELPDELAGPAISRNDALAILEAAGAPRHMLTKRRDNP